MIRRELFVVSMILLWKSATTQSAGYTAGYTAEWNWTGNAESRAEYRTLRVATEMKSPWMTWTSDGYQGFLVQLLDLVSDAANFSYVLVNSSTTGQLMYVHGEAVLSGVIADLVSGAADLGLSDLIVSEGKTDLVYFTSPFATSGAHILVRKPAGRDRGITLLLSPFSAELWVVIIVSVMMAILVTFLGQRFARRDKTVNDRYTDERQPSDIPRFFAMVLSFEGKNHLEQLKSSVLMSVCTWAFIVVTFAMYVGNLTNCLIATSLPAPAISFKTFEQLADQSNVQYGGWFGMTFDLNDELQRKMRRHIESKHTYYSSLDAAVRSVMDNKKPYAAIVDGLNGQYLASQTCDLLLLQEQLFEMRYAMACPKTTSGQLLCNNISRVISSLKENGTLYQLMTRWWESDNRCPSVTEDDYVTAEPVYFRSLSVLDLELAFLIFWMGIISGSIGIFVDRFYATKSYTKAQTEPRNELRNLQVRNGNYDNDVKQKTMEDTEPEGFDNIG